MSADRVEALMHRHRNAKRWMPSRCRCLDCRRDTIEIGHYYMVSDELWAATGVGPRDGMLCLDYLARRIGRDVTFDDFTALGPVAWLDRLDQALREVRAASGPPATPRFEP